MNLEALLIAVAAVLILLPRALARLRIPLGITAFFIGLAAREFAPEVAGNDFVKLFSVLGISSLFLLAGMEINFEDLKKHRTPLIQHILIQLVAIIISACSIYLLFEFSISQCTLISLALWTPSTGFIMDSVGQWKVSEDETFWIKTKAIAAEIAALFLMFVVTQSESSLSPGVSFALMGAFIIALPVVFHFLARLVLPFSKGSEFSLLVLLAMACAVFTKEIGAYYLIGAFFVGLVSNQTMRRLPEVSNKQILDSLNLFAGFFIPFYFFNSGTLMFGAAWSLKSLWYGLAVVGIVLPIRVGITMLHRALVSGEKISSSFRIGVAMAPNLIFGLVIAGIIFRRGAEADWILPALIIYTFISSIMPALVLGKSAKRYHLVRNISRFFGTKPAKSVATNLEPERVDSEDKTSN
ncbi:MAG: sodium:proton antiporter [Deltaproteobacteria bacterium CG11_big_fil_rev_8_21_14_0_20_45_16]|nr:MAG: sodium:proton antiporter [Deltaproteobacteria bacterium CG11_big_fil_rev_8_21_14_0_20_45_16]